MPQHSQELRRTPVFRRITAQRPSTRAVLLTAILLGTLPTLLGISTCSSPDADLDGWTVEAGDCDDANASVYPGAPESCDGLDNDCDGSIDPTSLWYPDADGDGAGSPSSSVAACAVPAGYVATNDDCDDGDATRYPGSLERCNLIDDDCDGAVDEHLPAYRFRDKDADGFGDPVNFQCEEGAGYISVTGDCNDQSAAIHPGAADTTGDGIDQDCGGTSAADPHLGFGASSAPDLSTALGRMQPGNTLWIGPGTWPASNLVLQGAQLRLASTHGPAMTILDAQGKGRVFSVENAPGLIIEGVTVSGGYVVGNGGGLKAIGSDLQLKNCNFHHNQAWYVALEADGGGQGGALYLENTSAKVERCTFHDNLSAPAQVIDSNGITPGGGGGAISTDTATLTVLDSSFEHNTAAPTNYEGGSAIFLLESDGTIVESLFQNNLGWEVVKTWRCDVQLSFSRLLSNDMGPMFVYSKVNIRGSEFQKHRIGGLSLEDSFGEVRDSLIALNGVSGLNIYDVPSGTEILVTHNRFQDNFSSAGSAALDVDASTVVASHNTFVGNTSPRGGAIYGESCILTLKDNLITHSVGFNIFNDEDRPCEMEIAYNTIFSPTGQNINTGTLDGTNSTEDPHYIRFTPNRDYQDDDLHLLPDSPARTAGEPTNTGLNDNPLEQGLYGGSRKAADWYADTDQDGLPDGWESGAGSVVGRVDSSSDPDQDGLTQLMELEMGSLPGSADSDGDLSSDGAEVASGSNPLDWYERPNANGGKKVVSARVPQDFPTVQAAIDASLQQATILVRPGRYAGQTYLHGKTLMLDSQAPPERFVLDAEAVDAIFWATWADLTVRHGEFTHGHNFYWADASGLNLRESTARLEWTDFTDNSAAQLAGALGAWDSQVSLYQVRFLRNIGERGAGLSAEYSTLSLENILAQDNTGSYGTGGIEIRQSDVVGTNIALVGNRSEYGSTGARFYKSQIDLTGVLAYNNVSEGAGAAISTIYTTGTIRQATIFGNRAITYGGGLLAGGPAAMSLSVVQSVLAYNSPQNLLATDGNEVPLIPMPVLASYSDFYNPAGQENFNALAPGSRYKTIEPQFLAYDAVGLPSEPHLSRNAALINYGDPSTLDVDGSTVDPGAFGGETGACWDLDQDGIPAWFWPGDVSSPPIGFSAQSYDGNDLDF